MKTTTNYTWLGYMETLRSKYCNAAVYDPQLLNVFLNTNTLSSSFFSLTNPAVYILDYRCGRYLKMSGNFGGHSSEIFLSDGINKFMEVYDKQQFRIFNEQIFPDRLKILNKIDYREHTNYVFSGSLTIRDASGTPINYLQRNFYLSDTDGHPLISIGIFIEMEHYPSGGQMWQTVHQLGADGMMLNTALFNKTYPISSITNVFSKREKEVLLWMSNGLSSKMIAGKLFLSEHTVINHRRNMQDKTKSANAIALIKYAIETGAI